ncbi:MAG TPA: DNA polymerase domain-containing protein [Firmicutes bacterium]|nr:DNA polymerase domain-containing protein [Bacillota bacterium]
MSAEPRGNNTRKMQGVKLTNLDKVLWPEDGITKGQLIDYYLSMSCHLLRYLKDRPLYFTRYPDGIHGKWFYQKNVPVTAPPWIETWSDRSGTRLMIARSQMDMLWIGSQASIEIHPWFSTRLNPLYPNYIVFDLDPAPPAGLEQVKVVAKTLCDILRYVGLVSFPKTSGATGVHVCVPIRPVFSYEACRQFVEVVARLVLKQHPDIVTLERRVEKRSGKVYIDYLQNAIGKTVVSLFSPRPLTGAPVSVPFEWSELDGIRPSEYTLLNVPAIFKDRLFRIEYISNYPQDLLDAAEKLKRLMAAFAPARYDLSDHT